MIVQGRAPIINQTFDILRTIDMCASPQALMETVTGYFQQIGLDKALSMSLPAIGRGKETLRDGSIYANTMPIGWVQRYLSQNYVDVCHTCAAAKRGDTRIRWRDLQQTHDDENKRIQHERGEFGLNDGLTWCFKGSDGSIVGLSMGGRVVDASLEDMQAINLIGTYTLGKILILNKVPPNTMPNANPHLSAQQKEILKHTADGLLTGQIADRMGLTDKGVEYHFNRIGKQMRTRTRTHAVAKAIRDGIIT